MKSTRKYEARNINCVLYIDRYNDEFKKIHNMHSQPYYNTASTSLSTIFRLCQYLIRNVLFRFDRVES